jgi:hypothetical protein
MNRRSGMSVMAMRVMAMVSMGRRRGCFMAG